MKLSAIAGSSETARDTLARFKSLPAERRSKMLAGLTEEREKAVLTAWHTRTDRK